jgi:hemin uptake protein HemP
MRSEASKSPSTPETAAEARRAGETRRIPSSDLLGEASALVIVHNGREYLLRVTQNGKLILTA